MEQLLLQVVLNSDLNLSFKIVLNVPEMVTWIAPFNFRCPAYAKGAEYTF